MEPWIDHVLQTQVYQHMFPAERLQEYRARNAGRQCDKACQDVVAFWSSGILLGEREEMDRIADAILNVYENRDKFHAV